MKACHAREGGGTSRFKETATGESEIYGRYVCIMHEQTPTWGLLLLLGRLHVASRSLVLDRHSYLPNQWNYRGTTRESGELRGGRNAACASVWVAVKNRHREMVEFAPWTEKPTRDSQTPTTARACSQCKWEQAHRPWSAIRSRDWLVCACGSKRQF